MTTTQLDHIFAGIDTVRCAVFGDFALDVYIDYADATDDYSVETGKLVQHGTGIRCEPGGAGTVTKDLAALQPAAVSAFAVLGDDIFGHELRSRLDKLGIDTSGVVQQSCDWQTPAYIKPLLDRVEQNRLDFGGGNIPSAASIDALLERLETIAGELDVLIINQQTPAPLLTPALSTRLSQFAAAHPDLLIIADCRDTSLLPAGVMVKLNAHEVGTLLQCEVDERDSDRCIECAQQAFSQLGAPVLMTCGENGIVVATAEGTQKVPGVLVLGELDTVGAGDSCMSAYGTAVAGGADDLAAAEFAMLAAAITVRKLNQTGTASREELRSQATDARYVYAADIADDIKPTAAIGGATIECISGRATAITHAVFDHDGTISTLRHGWEPVMLEYSMGVIAGDTDLTDEQRQRIAANIENLINGTTGIQTIRQMMFVADMVRREGLVAETEILDGAGYKAGYLDRLMVSVRQRIERVRDGSLTVTAATIPGAVDFLDLLCARNVELTLTSGTDEADVKNEADALGYIDKFSTITGSLGNKIGDAKRVALQRLAEQGVKDGIVMFGDGPVEIMEARHMGAIAVGIASDESNPGQLCPSKRRRLIRAGADWIVPDFRDGERLLEEITK